MPFEEVQTTATTPTQRSNGSVTSPWPLTHSPFCYYNNNNYYIFNSSSSFLSLSLSLVSLLFCPFCFNGRSLRSKSFAAPERPRELPPFVLRINRLEYLSGFLCLPLPLRLFGECLNSYILPDLFAFFWFREIRVHFHANRHGSIPSLESEDSSRSCFFSNFYESLFFVLVGDGFGLRNLFAASGWGFGFQGRRLCVDWFY